MEPYLGIPIGVGILLVLFGFMNAAETALTAVNRIRIKQRIEEGSKAARAVDVLIRDRQKMLTAVLAWNTLLLVTASVLTAIWAENIWAARSGLPPVFCVVAASLVMALIVLMLCEIVPKRVAVHNAEKIAMTLSPLLVILVRPLSGLLQLLVTMTNPLVKLLGGDSKSVTHKVTEEDIRMMITVGREEGDLEAGKQEMIHSIFEFTSTIVREVMVPRTDMICIEVGDSVSTAVEVALREGHSRLPVYERTVDNIAGIVYTRDLLGILKDQKMHVPLRDVLRPTHFVPGTKKVEELLREFQRDKISMAIVVDEYGGTDGLITMEDIVEEIVGEIEDEYDIRESPIQRLEDGAMLVDGKIIIEDINEILGTHIPATEYETVGGFVYGQLGGSPAQGEIVEVDGLVMTVESVHRQRITKLRLRKKDGAVPPEGAPLGPPGGTPHPLDSTLAADPPGGTPHPLDRTSAAGPPSGTPHHKADTTLAAPPAPR